jgi:restriction endonuclease S subunit
VRIGPLRQVLRIRSDIVHPRDKPNGEGRFVGLEHIESNTGRRTGELKIRLEELTGRKARFFAGDIVYGYLRPYLNKVWLADFDGYCSVDQYVIQVDGAIADREFVSQFLRSAVFLKRAPIDVVPGQLPRIRIDEFLSVPFVCPTLGDQRKIAAELENQLANAEAARTSAGVRYARVDDLRIRLLRELLPLPPDGPWEWVRLDAAAEFLDGRRRPISASERASRTRGVAPDELVPYYGANGPTGWIDKHLFDEPLVLLAEDGGAFGSSRTPIAYRIDGRAWVNNHAHVLRPRPGVDVDYLGYALSIRPDVGGLISGSTRGKLNRSVAGGIRVPLPPVDVQRRIAAELRERLATIATMEASIRSQQGAIEALSAALLRRAFDGLAA